MLPIMLDLSRGPVVLYGCGAATVRRLAMLRAAGAADLRLFGTANPSAELRAEAGADLRPAAPSADEIATARVVFVADVAEAEAARVAALARAAGVLVNVEDRRAYCDFYTPSMVRRGDLVLAVSTGGKSPALARRIRERLEGAFGPEWAERLNRLGRARDGWRAAGADMATVARRTHEFIDEERWFSEEEGSL